MATTPAPTTGSRFSTMSPDDHGASIWITTALTLVYTILTFAARFVVKRGLYNVDDVILSLAHILALGQWIAIFVALSNGLGKTLTLVSPTQQSQISKAFFASRVLLYLVLALSKCGTLLFLRQIFSQDMRRAWIACNIVVSIAIMWGFAAILAVSVRCSPSHVWLDQGNNHCSNDVLRVKIITIFDVITDCIITALPAYLIWKINMPIKRKFMVLLAFSSRLPVIAFSIAYLMAYSVFIRSGNRGVALSPPIVWQEILLGYSLMSTTIPCLKGFVSQFTTGGMGYTEDLSTGYGASYQMDSIKSKASALKSTTSGSLILRPDPVEYSAYAEYWQKTNQEDGSIHTESSRRMIIQKHVSLTVRHD